MDEMKWDSYRDSPSIARFAVISYMHEVWEWTFFRYEANAVKYAEFQRRQGATLVEIVERRFVWCEDGEWSDFPCDFNTPPKED